MSTFSSEMNITDTTTDQNTTSEEQSTTEADTTGASVTTNIPTSSSPVNNASNSSGGMPDGAIAGIVIGCLIVGVVVLGIAFFLWRRKKKAEKKRSLIDNPLPGAQELKEMEEKQIKESKKQNKNKTKKSKKQIIENEPPSTLSITSVGYENVPKKKKKESPYANTTKDGAPALPIDEEPSSDYLEPENMKLEYSGVGGIDYYMTNRNNEKDGDYDVPSQKSKGKLNENKNNSSQNLKDYVNVPNKLQPGQAPKPGKSIKRDPSTDSTEQQEVYENVESENEISKRQKQRR